MKWLEQGESRGDRTAYLLANRVLVVLPGIARLREGVGRTAGAIGTARRTVWTRNDTGLRGH